MATLVLTTVGTAIGGPVGGALGALIGQSVDSSLFAPKLEGPRLDSLAVQSSRYGSPLPLLYGRTRTAGTVVWARDLTERRSTTGGKGKPKITSYAYTADFAVALSARPIERIGRVWADGSLLTTADGRLSVDGAMRLHPGTEDQDPDPLIEQEEGRGRAPAYRGTAYVVFEGLALESFGNRVPLLSFEVVADRAPVAAGRLVEELSGGAIGGSDAGPALVGAMLGGGRRREAVAALLDPLGLALSERNGRTVVSAPDPSVRALPPRDLGAHRSGEDRVPPVALSDRPTPSSVALGFAEPARDYQPGRQRASAGGADPRPEEHELPVVLDAADAKGLAAQRLDRALGSARRAVVTLPLSALTLAPGDTVRLPDAPGRWRVEDWLLERHVVRLELAPVVRAEDPALAADGGRGLPDRPAPGGGGAGARLLDLPYLTTEGRERLYAALFRPDGGDRPLPLLLERGGVAEPLGPSAPAAVAGRVVAAPGVASPHVLDLAHAVELALDSDSDLSDADDGQLATNANALLLGDEIVQFGRAEPLVGRHWRLTRLLRGRRGTEAAIGTSRPGDRAVLLQPDTLQPVDAGDAGASLRLRVDRPDSAEPSDALASPGGAPPLSPVHLTARRRADGAVDLAWIRRSRAGWAWVDGTDAPVGEEAERYELTVAGRSVELTEQHFTLADPPTPLAFTVRQIGTHGRSAPTTYKEPTP